MLMGCSKTQENKPWTQIRKPPLSYEKSLKRKSYNVTVIILEKHFLKTFFFFWEEGFMKCIFFSFENPLPPPPFLFEGTYFKRTISKTTFFIYLFKKKNVFENTLESIFKTTLKFFFLIFKVSALLKK